ncbi:MAG: hypothetical protein ABIE70_05225 [bacterium]
MGRKRTALSLWGDASASRITENAKTSFDLWGTYSEDRYLLEDGTEWTRSRSKGVGASQVIGLGDHWSGQVEAQLSSSEYSNKRSQTYGSAAVEFNLFPYNESTHRQLRFGYAVAVRYVDYLEETIFDRTNEWLASQQGSLTLDLVQPWGSIRTSLSASHYLHNINRNRMWIDGTLSLRLAEGLSIPPLGGQVNKQWSASVGHGIDSFVQSQWD